MAKRNFLSNLFQPMKRKYDGAAKTKRTARWFAPSTSANAEVWQSLITLRNRARDLRRNNPYAARAIQGVTNNVIGPGIETQFRMNGEDSPDMTPISQAWEAWTCSKDFDYDGRHDIYGLQRLIMDAIVESGEVLIRRRYRAGMRFPLQYQVLESDFLDINKTFPAGKDGNHTIQGIEFDGQGRRTAYYLFESHPGGYDNMMYTTTLASNRVPVEEVLHLFRMDRPGQARGVTWLAPVIIRLKDLDDYEDAQLMRQKIAACFTAFVRDISGEIVDPNDDPDANEIGAKLEPGIIEHLPTGKMIEFSNPPVVQNYKEYVTSLKQAIAAGIGVTYELITSDLSQVNFSSARMGWLEMNRNIQAWRNDIIIPHFLDPVVADFKKVSLILGQDLSKTVAIHVPPKREMIDPTKEIPATQEALRAGLTTWSDEIMALGKDPAQHFAQYAKDLQFFDKNGIKLDSDPRNPKSGSGSPPPPQQNEPTPTGGN